jgi:pimeloyl-ACP methyl ester carboxylesterase
MASIVLIHGAWSDASVWDQIAQRLVAAGHTVATPNLPAHGDDLTPPAEASLDGYVATVISAASALGGPVVLVGHSMAGTVISMAAEQRPDLISHLVYVAAFMLPSGQSLYGFTQVSQGMATSALGPALRPGDGVLGVEPAQFVDVFCADAPEPLALAAQARLRPDPLAPLGTPILTTPERWGSVTRSYIYTAIDRCVSPGSQREMVEAIGVAAHRTINAGHLAMLSQPDDLAAAIEELIL